MAFANSADVSQLSEKWLSGNKGKKPAGSSSKSDYTVLIEPRPESLGLGAKLSAKARQTKENEDRVRAAISKGMKTGHRAKFTKNGESSDAPKRRKPDVSESSDEEESRTTIVPTKKKKKI